MVILVDSRMSGDKYMCLIHMSPLSDQVEPELIQSLYESSQHPMI